MVMIDKVLSKCYQECKKALKSPINKGFKACLSHSHSTVAGGLEVMSYTIRLTWATSFTIRTEIFARLPMGYGQSQRSFRRLKLQHGYRLCSRKYVRHP